MSRLFLITERIETPNKRHEDFEALLPALVVMLRKHGVTKCMVHEKYLLKYPDGYLSSAFLVMFNNFMQVGRTSMKMIHKAGDKLFVDFI